jgi:Peptidase family M48
MTAEPASGPVPGPLPQSTTRFVLLALMACAGSLFAAYWWLVSGRGGWLAEQSACLPRLAAAGGQGAFIDCINSVALRQEGVVFLGPVAVITASVLIAAGSVPVLLLAWGTVPVRPRLAKAFSDRVDEARLRREPRLRAVARGVRSDARAFGCFPRYWILADPALTGGPEGPLTAMLRHELAHLRGGDIDRARVARAIWRVFFFIVTPALVISLAVQGGLAWAAVGSRMLILLAFVHLAHQSLMRAREHEADLLAARHGPLGDGTEFASVFDGPWRRSPRLPSLLLAHPSWDRRKDVVNCPQLAARLSVSEFFSVGVAGGVIFQELAIGATAALPGAAVTAYWVTGVIVAIPLCAVLASALWRHQTAGPWPLRRPVVALAGALLGAGLVAGSLLAPRAATNWESVRVTFAPTLPATLSITAAGTGVAAALGCAAVTGCTLFTLWAGALTRELAGRPPQGTRGWLPWTVAASMVAVLAVPLGTWFALSRIVADSVESPQGGQVAGLLQGQQTLAGLTATSAAALILLAAAAFRRGPAPRHGPRALKRLPWSLLVTAACCAAAASVPVAAWYAGATAQRAVKPAPALAATPGGGLPLLPPSVTAGRGPVPPGVLCWAFSQVYAQDAADPQAWRQVGALLQRTPDAALDMAGRVLVSAGSAPPGSTGNAGPQAWTAAGLRCVLLLDSPPAPASPASL